MARRLKRLKRGDGMGQWKPDHPGLGDNVGAFIQRALGDYEEEFRAQR